MKPTKELLGARIKELRKAKGLSQKELAEHIGIEPQHMNRLEVGRSYPTFDRLERIAAILNVPLQDFFEFMHHQGDEQLLSEIIGMVKSLDNEQQKFVFRMLKMLKNL